MLLIGGWNGRQRTPDVHAYDAQEDCWLPMTAVGFPEGGGLSSHTATLLNSSEVSGCYVALCEVCGCYVGLCEVCGCYVALCEVCGCYV